MNKLFALVVLCFVNADSEIQNLEWNRYVTPNFTILSLDNAQGKMLYEHIEKINQNSILRWGFPELKFDKECRIFCVSDQRLLKKLFNLDQPKVEFRKDLTVIWFVLDGREISPLLTQVCLEEFELRHHVKIGFWFKRGSSLLSDTKEIRQELIKFSQTLEKDQPIYPSEKMLTMSQEDYLKESLSNRVIYDRQAILLCLMLRKEFGEAKLQGFLRLTNRNSPKDGLKIVYEFDGYDQFDKQFIRFMKDLSSDVVNNKTPDHYLEIKAVR